MILNKPSWKIIIFSPVNKWHATAFANHKADTFVIHQWCPLHRDSTVASTTRWVQPKILSLNFTSIKIEGGKVNSSQNECTLGGEGGGARKMNKGGEQGGGREGGGCQNLGILSERTFWMSPKLCNYREEFVPKLIINIPNILACCN